VKTKDSLSQRILRQDQQDLQDHKRPEDWNVLLRPFDRLRAKADRME